MSFPANVIPVFGSQRAYADLNFSGGSFGLDGRIVNDLTALPGFTFTRASLAMGYDATGKLTYGPNNLCLQSQTFDNAYWTKSNASVTTDAATAPDGTLTADTLVESATTAVHSVLRLSVFGQVGSRMVFSAYVKNAGRRYISLYPQGPGAANASYCIVDTQAGAITGTGGAQYVSSGILDMGGGWYRAWVVFNCTDAAVHLNGYLTNAAASPLPSYTGDGTSGIYLWGAQLEAVTYQTTPSTYYPTTTAAYYGPRLVYDPVTLASLGILVEEARTNVLTQSNTFTSGTWTTATNITVAAADAVSVDGTTNASRLTDNTTAGVQHRLYRDYTFTSATAHTLSLFVKRNDHRWMRLFFYDGTTSFYANFDLLNGAVGNKQASTTSRITAVGNSGWYRVEMTATVAAAVGNVQIVMLGSDDTVVPSLYTGTGTSFWCYGAQLEAGTGASSYIPTTTASVTRAADVANLTGIVLSGGFTLASDSNAGVVGTFRVATVSDGTTVNRFGNFAANPTALRCLGVVGGSATTIESGARTVGTAFKQASRFDGVSTIATSGNGAAVVSGSSALTPSVLTQLGIGGIPGVPDSVGTTISRIRIYNRALSDAQLQSLTS